ncbi:MAG: intradiol ring-cleavage dioxygenase [Gaiellaceae bacterium]
MADLGNPMTRRRALQWAGGLGLATFVSACTKDGDSGGSTAPGTTAADATAGAAPDCVLMPELTEGPFYLDLDLLRSDIAEDRPGLPLDLSVQVVDASACEPIEGAAVDVWHCDAAGAYSGVEGSVDATFCRGVQLTDSAGAADFRTVFPGWYSGRAVHIHVRVSTNGEIHTGQLFFDPEATSSVYATEPYASRGEPDTPNASDGIYAESGGVTVVAVTVDGESSGGAVTLGVQRG